ncbi:MAG: hypothetical protein HFI90_07065 [Clostridia bacterium]|nr:hypothetical protein [Clostridia bacterium]
MGHFLERVERGTVPDKLTQNPRERNVRTMQDIVADNEREGVKMPSVHGEIAGKSGKKTTPQKQQSKNIFALSNNPVKAVKGIENSIALYENLRNKYGQSRIKKNDAKNEKGKADSSNMDLSAWNVWKNGIRQLFSNPWYVNSNENLGVARNLAKSAIDQSIDSSVKREYTSRPGEIIETRWSGKTYGVDRNNNGKLDTFEVESGSNPFNNFYYTLAKPAAVAAKDSLIAGGHAFNKGVYSLAAGVGDYLYNLGRAGKAAVEQKNPFAKVELKMPLGDSAPIQNIKNNANTAAERANQSAGYFGTVGEFTNQITQSAAQMAPSLAAAYLTGGQSASADLSRAGMTAFEKATQLLKLPKHMIPTFLSQAGQSYNDALEQTGDPTKALEYGIINGYLNALIEQGGVQEGVATGSLKDTAKQSAWDFVKDNMLEEGVEEITQNVTEGALRKMMVDPSAPLFSVQDENAVINPKRDLYAGAVGAVAGGLFGGANKAMSNLANATNRSTSSAQNRLAEDVVTTPEIDTNTRTNINLQEDVSTPPQNQSHIQAETQTSVAIKEGNLITSYTADGQPINTKYAVVESSDIIASHDESGNVNPAYPQELQPRDRERTASQLQVQKIANNLQPAMLGENTLVSAGAPVVGSDMVVESGNGRTAALRQAYKGEKGASYKQWLVENAEQFGIRPADVENMNQPVLVRVREGAENRSAFTQMANDSGVASMGATETAAQDAGRLTPEMLSSFQPSEDGTINNSGNTGFIAQFVENVIPQSQRGEYITADGKLSQAGVNRVKNALFYKAYQDSQLMSLLAEETDSNIRNVTNAMIKAAPEFVKLQSRIDSGDLSNSNIPSDIAAVAKTMKDIKDGNIRGISTAEELLAQTALDNNGLTDSQREILSAIATPDESGKVMMKSSAKMGRFFTEVARTLNAQEGAAQTTLVDMPELSTADVIQQAKNNAEYDERLETQTIDRAARAQEGAAQTTQQQMQEKKQRVEKVGKAIGRKVEWYNDQSDPVHANQNGYYKDGVIHINENAQNPYMTVLGHESFHSLNAKDRAAIINFVKENTNVESADFQRYRDERRRAYTQEYQKQNRLFSDWDFWEEYAADNMENFFQDETFVNKLAQKNKGTTQRLLDTLRSIWEKIKGAFSLKRDPSNVNAWMKSKGRFIPKHYSIGMNEAGLSSGMTDAQFKKIERMFEKALGNELDSGVDGKTRYSVETLPDGRKYVQADRQVITGNDPGQWAKQVEQYINNEIRQGKDVTVYGADGDPLTLTGKTAWKGAYRNQNLTSDRQYATKLRAETHIDELAEVSRRFGKPVPDKNNKHGKFADKGWQYRTAYFMDNDGRYYQMRISTAMNDAGNIVYNIGEIKERSNPVYGSSTNSGALNRTASSDTNTITQNQDSVNSSISDSAQNDTEKPSMKTSKFYDSTQNTDALNTQTKEAIAEQAEAFEYEGISNKETIQKALKEFQNNPLKTASHFLTTSPERVRTKDIATGFVLLQKYQEVGDFNSAVEVAKKLREIGTQKGQEVQAFSILNRLTPEGMLYYAQGELDSALEIIGKKKGQEWLDKNRDKFKLTDDEAKFIVDSMKRVPNIQDERQRKVIIGEVQKLVQEKMPKKLSETVADDLRAWQRVSMLLNPKTIVTRNAGANAIIAPVHLASEAIGSGLDKLVSKATGVRTTTLPNAKNLGKGFVKGGYDSFDDFRRGINTRDIQNDRFNISSGQAFRGKNPISKAMRGLDRVTSYLLDTGDRPFFEAYFLDSINGQMKANKVDKPTADMIDIATQSALEKTWQDDNAVTNSMKKIKQGLNLGMKFGLGDIVVPFIKTPANLGKALVDFSPVGFTKGLVVDGTKLIQAQKHGTLTPQIQRKFVNNVSKGIVGMLMYAGAYALASSGFLTGSDKEDDKDARAFKRNVLGENQYAFKLGNKTYTYDWAQPIGGVMAISADIANKNVNGESAISVITNALAAGGNTLFEQSVLTGVAEFFKNADDGLVAAFQGAAGDIPAQAVPTLLKQISDYIDPVKRSTYDPDKLQQSLNTGIAKIPGLEKKLQPSVDVLGRDVKRYGGENNLFNVFLNPANVNVANPTPELQEVWKVFEDTQDTGVFPKVVGNSITNKGMKYVLSAEEKTDYQRTLGEETNKGLKELMSSKGYKSASAADKAEYIKTIIANSDSKARKELLKKKGVTDTIEDFKNDISNKKKYYSIWDDVEPSDVGKQAKGKSIGQVSSVVNALSKKSKLTPNVISGITKYIDEIEKRSPNAVDKELYRLGVLKEDYTDTEDGDMDVTTGYMSMFTYTDDGQKYSINVNYSDMPQIMREIEKETYKQMERLINNQYTSKKKKTYGQRYTYKNASADQKIKWVNEVRTDVKNEFKSKYSRKYGVTKVPNKLKKVK